VGENGAHRKFGMCLNPDYRPLFAKQTTSSSLPLTKLRSSLLPVEIAGTLNLSLSAQMNPKVLSERADCMELASRYLMLDNCHSL
jgi:hypothetical protein